MTVDFWQNVLIGLNLAIPVIAVLRSFEFRRNTEFWQLRLPPDEP